MEMDENIAVHSDKHFQYLLERSASEIDSNIAEANANYRVTTDHGAKEPEHDSDSGEVSQEMDVFQTVERDTVDDEGDFNSTEDNKIRFINQGETQQIVEETTNESMASYEEHSDHDRLDRKLHHRHEIEQEFSGDNGNNKNPMFFDSLDISGLNQSYGWNEDETKDNAENDFRIYDGFGVVDKGITDNVDSIISQNRRYTDEDKQEHQHRIDGQESMKNAAQLKPGFKYKEPEPKFITRNRMELGRRAQGSYSQRFLKEKKTNHVSKTNKALPLDGENINAKASFPKQQNDIYPDLYNLGPNSEQNVNMDGDLQKIGGINAAGDVDNSYPPIQNLKNLRENIEISRLEDLIREEEENLKNHVFDISFPQMTQVYPTEVAHNEVNFSTVNQDINIHQAVALSLTRKSIGNLSHITKKEDSLKGQSYAQLHSLASDKHNSQQSETPSSYAVQHLEKRNKSISYKKYGLKDYQALNKEIVLQRSLGPDKLSDEYLQKVAHFFNLYHHNFEKDFKGYIYIQVLKESVGYKVYAQYIFAMMVRTSSDAGI